ncbi:MAG: hypothetical protein UW73_C0011G0022 [Microgenomates group bacterium GW2011_GWB1_44_8]|nr:MAG: hypothetical protein UW73_C0011G0022 [Microgenomates group bacterium GW2011_GWB1_44_8]
MNILRDRGIQFAVAAATISGLSVFLNKFALEIIKPPILFTSTKNFIVGLMVMLILLLTGKWRGIFSLTRKEVSLLLAISIIGGSIPFYLFFTGLSQVAAANSALIQKTLIFLVILLAFPLLKERLTKLQFLGICLVFIANFTIGGLVRFDFSSGEVMILMATILWSVEYMIAKVTLKTVDLDLVVATRMFLGSVILMTASFLTIPDPTVRITSLTTSQLAWLMLTALILFAYVSTWYRALKFAPVISVTAVLAGSTLVTNVLSAVFVTHVWTVYMLIQAVLIILGIGFIVFTSSLGQESARKARIFLK